MHIKKIGYGNSIFEDAFKVRRKVFVEEQGVPESLERDMHDKSCLHIVMYHSDTGVPISTGRLLKIDSNYYIGRLAVLEKYRGAGLAKELMIDLISKAWDLGASRILIHAQKHAVNFYKKLGFDIYGSPFIEAGIEHIHMEIKKQEA